MKKLFLLFLAAALIFALVSCGDTCTEHKDLDKDGKCDVCSTPVEPEKCEKCVDADENGECDECGSPVEIKKGPLVLIEDSEAKFQLVISKTSGTKISKAADDFVKDMKKLGVEITLVKDESEENIKDCEIILGDVDSRGAKYNFDEHTLGIKGEVITRIDNKIIITAGSTNAIVELFEDFCKDVIGLKSGAKKSDVANVEFKSKQEVLKIQNDYRITAIKVGEDEITGYTIAADLNDQTYLDAARTLQTTLYERAGYWLEIVALEEATEKSIVIQHVDKGASGPAGAKGFLIKTVDGQIQILCAYDNALLKSVNALISEIVITQGEYVFENNAKIMEKEVSVVYYKDYPNIKGDGSTNDYEAIKEVHDYANISGQKVVAEDGKEYYIDKLNGLSIQIKTDVDFGTATFIIDDTFITENDKERSGQIFSIVNDYENVVYGRNSELVAAINAAGGIKTTDKTIPLNLGYDVFVKISNEDRRVYHRWGSGSTGPGVAQEEVLLIHADNSVDESTPLLFDFEKLTKITIIRTDIEPITISGGLFITYAASYGMDISTSTYTYRGISITRPNVTITGLEHRVVEEETKAFYQGFIWIRDTTNIRVENTKLSGRGGTGTYDISINWGNNVTFYNCTQYNMFDENGRVYNEQVYWGIMGSNYSKNINYDNCVLSRFDAHAGVYNFSITNCRIAQINITGGGLGVVENCVVYRTHLFTLREDYGTYWMGDIRVKNVVLVQDTSGFYVFSGNVHDVDVHDPEMGFKTQMPNLYLENVTATKYDGTLHDDASLIVYHIRFDQSLFLTGKGEHNEILPAATAVIKQPEGGLRIASIGDETLEWDLVTTVEYKAYDEE